MIAAGKLDQRITIERRHDTKGPAGKVTATWTAHATVWAERLAPTVSETADQNGVAERTRVTFRLRYLAISPADRLIHAGRTFNIVAISELGRREGLEIQCEAS